MKRFPLFLILLVFVTACSRKNKIKNAHFDNNRDFIISTKDHKVDLVLSDSTVFMKLAPKVLAKVNKSLNSSKNNTHGNNWADKFSRFVVSNVQSLINKKLEYPLKEIKNITYQNGGLKFTYYHDHIITFNKIVDQDKPALDNFNEEEAKMFIRRFHQLKSR